MAEHDPHRRTLITVALIGAAAAIVAAVITAVLKGAFDSEPARPTPSGEILAPGGGLEVSTNFAARGSVSNVPSDQAVWLTIRVGDHLFPQTRIEGPERGKSRWRQTVSLPGSPTGGKFSLALLLVGDQGERQIAEWQTRRSPPSGMAAIPGGRALYEVSDLRARLCARDPIRTASLPGTARIVSVNGDQRVGPTLNPLLGSYQLPAGSQAKVWIFVYSAVADRFYAQSHRDLMTVHGDLSAALLAGGRFRSLAGFGGRPGERYEVIAVLAAPSASGFLSRMLRAGNFGGLTAGQLPAGLEEKDCVPVHLRGA